MTRSIEPPSLDAAFPARAIAERFLRARREARALPDYPGPLPSGLAQGYAVQEAALALVGKDVVGWKVGRIPPDRQASLGADRLAGPIFRDRLWASDGGRPTDVPVFGGGFAAVEAEYVLRVGRDVEPTRPNWTLDEAAEVADAMFVGVEMAGSPLATINVLGPPVVVSDFGNNAGLILGPAVEGWRERALGALTCETFIDGVQVGVGGAASIPDGPLDSLRFLLESMAARGRMLRAGDLVSTGAATGIHDISPGQAAEVRFGGDGAIALRTHAARPD